MNKRASKTLKKQYKVIGFSFKGLYIYNMGKIKQKVVKLKEYNRGEFFEFRDKITNALNSEFPLTKEGKAEMEAMHNCKLSDYGKASYYNDTYKTKHGITRRIKMSLLGHYRHWCYDSELIEPRVIKIFKEEMDKRGWDYNFLSGYVVIRFAKEGI